ncbi:hypothetical protein BDZ97DRAFT_1804380 [Flammula alnicola]|nr:hypothetical protein BDZ97DRAFT_1804380 [Flammula alnicola]
MSAEQVKWWLADRALSFMAVSSATCVIYDHITTLDEEIELVWRRPKWSVVQVLYFINRYVGDGIELYSAFVFARHIIQNTEKSCRLLNILNGYLVTLVLCSMQGIMMYRVSSMYTHNRKIIAVLVTAYVSELCAIISIMYSAYGAHQPVLDPAPGVHLCADASFPDWMYTIWIPIMFFELLVLCLSIALGVVHYRSMKVLRSLPSYERRNSSSLVFILLRDSITFPFIFLMLCVLNIISFKRLPYVVKLMTWVFPTFVPVIMGSRLILNLREAYYQPFAEEINTIHGGHEADIRYPTHAYVHKRF